MRKLVCSATAFVALAASAAVAADAGMVTKAPPPPATPVWDIAFGGALMSDYNFRGISQSDRGPAVNAYIEPRYNILPNVQLYAGISATSTKLPTSPTGEFDVYGGIRPTIGPVSFDLGFIYYWYPRERQVFLDPVTGGAVLFPTPLIWTLNDTDYWEVFGKASYTWNDLVTVGANVYYSPSWLNTGAYGTYASGTLKVNLPTTWMPVKDIGWYVSGELGHYWFGTTDPILGSVSLPDYTYWNAGLAFTYKVFTLDVRYHDTDASKTECFLLTGDLRGLPGGSGALGQSKWCGQAVIAKLSADLTAMTNLK